MDSVAGESVSFVRIPLYPAPNQPPPAGAYQLSAKSADGAAQSSLTAQIR
jgi:hypothetical protein